MSDIPHCTGCGEYPGDLVADRIEELEAENEKLRTLLDAIAGYSDRASRLWRNQHPEFSAALRAEVDRYGTPFMPQVFFARAIRADLKEKSDD